MPRFTGASLLCELVLRIAPPEADPGLFEVLVTALDDVLTAEEPDVQPVVVASVWHLMSVLGFAPSVEACVECGRDPEPGRPARFDLREGGLRCDRCSAVGRFLPADEVESLRALVGGRTGRGASSVQMALLSEFIRYHAAEGSRIRSLEFLGVVAP
jgi:DNA repair protein RecO (recombination protein O)